MAARETWKTWNYGSTLGKQGASGGYTEYKSEGAYNSLQGYGFTGPRGGGFGGKGDRAPLPPQEDIMPLEVQEAVEKEQVEIDSTPGVIIKNEDGSLTKVPDPNADVPLPDVEPEPTRFDKSVHGILNGRNAAMFVNLEARKRNWELEFEEVESKGPVHDRTYSYTLTVGPKKDEDADILVTAGIAKSKKEAKRRCCEAMVLKIDDLPPAPPPPMVPMMPPGGMMGPRGMRFPGRFMRGGFGFPRGPRGMMMCRPRLPPPESEDTIFKKYDKTPKEPHPSQNHPISKLCEKAKRLGWPQPVWELVTEKIVDTKKHRHGRHNTMLYTYRVAMYPGKGQIEPKLYFGSGPTKKDAKFACGSVAWADIGEGDGHAIEGSSNIVVQNLGGEAAAAAGPPKLPVPGLPVSDSAQTAVKVEPETSQSRKRPADKKSEQRWLESVAKTTIKEEIIKGEIERIAIIKRMKEEERRKEEEERKEGVKVKTEPSSPAGKKDESSESEEGEIDESKERKRSRSRESSGYRSKRWRRSRSRSRDRSYRYRDDSRDYKRYEDSRRHRDRHRDDRHRDDRHRDDRHRR